MIKVIYNKVCGRCVQSEPLTSGMVGQPIHFEYSHDFDGLAVTAVFTDGKNTVDVVNPGNECIIPHEVLTTVGAMVKVGIYAVRGNEIVIPTVYANIGVVLKGADPSGDVSADPTLPIWAQTQALIGNLNDLTTEAKNNLVAAINEAAQSGGGGGSSIALDTTLTQSGKAADAKAVGDALAGKQDTISDLESIRTGAAKGATALQSVPNTYRTAAAQDVIDSGLSGRVSAIEGKESGWNSKYSKPTDGIPKTDLESTVQTSLDKAETALQSVPSTYRTASEQDTIDSGKVDKVTGKGLSSNDYTDAAKAKVDALAPVATSGNYNDLTNKPTIPTTLPNPNALTFTGAVTGSYDGSAPLSVEIPSGGGSSDTWEFINTITVGDDAPAFVTFSADSNGNAFALKKFYLITTAAPKTTYLAARINNKHWTEQFITGALSTSNVNANNPIRIIFQIVDNGFYKFECTNTNLITYRRDGEISPNGGKQSHFDSVSSVSFTWGVASQYAEGDVFTLYGVRT